MTVMTLQTSTYAFGMANYNSNWTKKNKGINLLDTKTTNKLFK